VGSPNEPGAGLYVGQHIWLAIDRNRARRQGRVVGGDGFEPPALSV
jgi:hypothetical protein